MMTLGQVAPATPAEADLLDGNDPVWLLNLDQVEPHTGHLLSKQIVDFNQAGNSTNWFDERSVLYSKLRPYLNKVYLPDGKGLCTTELVPLKPNPKLITREYLAYYLRSEKFLHWVNAQIDGAKMPRVSMKIFWNHEINLPPLEEQKRIAAILDKADSLRRKRAQAIALADDFLRATFLDMFGDPVTNPKGWGTVKLEELISSGPTNGLYMPSTYYVDADSNLGVPILRIDGFYNGKIAKGYKFKRVLIDDQTKSKFLLRDGSIVINRVNSKEYVGKAMLVSGLQEDTVFESNMMNFSIDSKCVNPRFLVDQLSDEFVRRQVAVMRKDAVNQSSINQNDVKSIEIRLPKLVLQEKYAAVAEAVDFFSKKYSRASGDLACFSDSLHGSFLA